ncbi:MAG: CRTAC1 family protein, partial [bacterium]|nr:CRTAC1 family protein [bacterium]
NHWLGLRLEGDDSNRDGLGAQVRVVGESGHEQWNHATTAVGYGSSSDKTVHFGLGRDRKAKLVEIYWPSGAVRRLEDVAGNHYLTVRER